MLSRKSTQPTYWRLIGYELNSAPHDDLHTRMMTFHISTIVMNWVPCMQIYHTECASEALAIDARCPICRVDARALP